MVECPVNDWDCPYYDNGDCTLENCQQKCDAFYSGEEAEKDEDEEVEDNYTLDDLGNNWY